jgi:hypothetical protein
LLKLAVLDNTGEVVGATEWLALQAQFSVILLRVGNFGSSTIDLPSSKHTCGFGRNAY